MLWQSFAIACDIYNLRAIGLEACYLHVVGRMRRDAQLQSRFERRVLRVVNGPSCVPLDPVSLWSAVARLAARGLWVDYNRSSSRFYNVFGRPLTAL